MLFDFTLMICTSLRHVSTSHNTRERAWFYILIDMRILIDHLEALVENVLLYGSKTGSICIAVAGWPLTTDTTGLFVCNEHFTKESSPNHEQMNMGFLKKPNLRLKEEVVPTGLVHYNISAPAWLLCLCSLQSNANMHASECTNTLFCTQSPGQFSRQFNESINIHFHYRL